MPGGLAGSALAKRGLAEIICAGGLPLSLPLVPHMLLALGLVAADRLILQRFRSMQEVGVYSLAYTLGMMMFLVTVSVAQAWSPMFYRMASQGDANGRSSGVC